MYSTPALPPDFVSLPYANPDAPQGGEIRLGDVGSFDSLNPHILKGRSPWQLRFWNYETLMGRSWDEPFTLYGLLAESIETGANREWVEFRLRPEAKFSDGSPVTLEDVLWSYETLGTVGHWRYRGLWGKIKTIDITGPRSIRFTFNEDNPELALLAGMRPILKKAQWEGKDFTASGIDIIPITSAPYQITDFEAGRFIKLEKNPDYWGNDLGFRKGTNNFDSILIEYFADAFVYFEAFKTGDIDIYREGNAEKWATQFDFPRAINGEITKSEVPHSRPTGMRGLFMNIRQDKFKDWRVREALIQAFNFEYINETQTGGRQNRITSYFSNSVLGLSPGSAPDNVIALLEPFKDELLPGTLEGYSLPVSDGTLGNRKNMRTAQKLLLDAGYQVIDGILQDQNGTPFEFEILMRQGAQEYLSIAEIYVNALERLGIKATIALVDGAQYTERLGKTQFDMVPYARDLSLSPGNEQFLYWSSEVADNDGTRNIIGIKSKALDFLLSELMEAKSETQLLAITRAMDRVLTAGRYVIPIYYDNVSRVAHKSDIRFPSYTPIYGDRIGFLPDVWWHE
ncbi:MAG: ABC transporter substrate-binding protein [Rhodobacteraceae bacterium]|nr:ABC transporter substrate-binding protein [Paracoccaceae bacterium]